MLSLSGKISKFFRRQKVSINRTVMSSPYLEVNPSLLALQNRYCDNHIKTSLYTFWNFLPINIFENFQNLSNLFFLTMVLCHLYARGSTSVWGLLGPLTFVLSISMIKDAVYDILRHKRDREINDKEFKVLKLGRSKQTLEWTTTKSGSIRVGDIVLCKMDDEFPCDLLILASSNCNSEVEITQVNIDGENSIKVRYSHPLTQTLHILADIESRDTISDEVIESLFLTVQCENPTEDLNSFEGSLQKSFDNPNGYPLSIEYFALRGAKLVRTKFMIGLAIYCGNETKLSLNSKHSKRKYGSRQTTVNNNLLLFIFSLVVLTISFAIANRYWLLSHDYYLIFLPKVKFTAWEFVQNAVRLLFLMTISVPISQIVTSELQELAQVYFISHDIDLYDEKLDIDSRVNSANIVDELGQIEYLFSDKTGTLTQNKMTLKYLANLQPDLVLKLGKQLHLLNSSGKEKDERALVEGANRLGFQVIKSIYQCIQNAMVREVQINLTEPCFDPSERDSVQTFVIDEILEFDYVRRKMSVLVHDSKERYFIFAKGAESSMLTKQACSPESSDQRNLANQRATEFATRGMRTLVFAMRQLDATEYKSLVNRIRTAKGLLGNDRKRQMAIIQNLVESNLDLLGVTGIEDELQPGAKECLRDLQKAGIKVWVLTGDKAETAISISKSVGHITKDMTLLEMTNFTNQDDFIERLFRELRQTKMKDKSSEQSNSKKKTDSFRNLLNCCKLDAFNNNHHYYQPDFDKPVGLVIDGETLRHALQPELRGFFVELCLNVSTVLCCRMTPLQKASIVQLVRSKPSHLGHVPVIAAVGDGGNDVAMLLQADVGIGIYGQEGKEAVRAADYAVPQFKHLRKLILVHGHWSYNRITMTLNLFYQKSLALVTPQVLLTFYSGFSAITSFDTILLALFNCTMTSLATLFYGLFERNIEAKVLLAKPHLYKLISRQANLKPWYVFLWILDGLWHGIVIYFAGIYIFVGGETFAEATFKTPGVAYQHSFDFSLYGCGTYLILWLSINLRYIILVKDYSEAVLVAMTITFGSNAIIFVLLETTTKVGNINFHSYSKLLRSPTFYFALPLVLMLANLPSFVWRVLSDMWWTNQINQTSHNSEFQLGNQDKSNPDGLLHERC